MIVKLLRSILLIICFAIVCFYITFYTEQGLQISIGLAEKFAPGNLIVGPTSGRLIDGWQSKFISYENDEILLQIDHPFIAWQPKKLLKKRLVIDEFSAQDIQVQLRPQANDQSTTFPLMLHIKHAAIQRNLLTKPQDGIAVSTGLAKLKIYEKTQGSFYSKVKIKQLNFQPFEAKANPVNFSSQFYYDHNQKQLNLMVTDISGALEEQPINGNIHIIFKDNILTIKDSYFESADAHLEASGTLGQTADLKWQMTIPDLNKLSPAKGSIESHGYISGNIDNPDIDAKISGKNFSYQRQKIQDIQLNLNGNLQQHNIQGKIDKTDLNTSFAIAGHYTNKNWHGTIKHLDLEEEHLGKISLADETPIDISAGKVSIDSFCIKTTYGKLCSSLSWDQTHGLQATSDVDLEFDTRGQMQLQLPELGISQQPFNAQPILATISLHTNNLATLVDNIPGFTHSKGQLNLDATIQGTLDEPKITGDMILDNAAVTLPRLGITLDQIQGTIKSLNETAIHYQLSAMLGKGTLNINGNTQLDKQFASELAISGEQLLVVNTSEARVIANTDIKLKNIARDVELRGNIEIPAATFKPKDFSNSVSLSDDVVFIDETNDIHPLRWRIDSKIVLKLGEAVHFDYMGLESLIGGNLELQDRPGTGTTALGKLVILKGRYSAYGQDLTIEEGQLLYTGGSINNPGINLRASKQVSSIATTGSSRSASMPAVSSSQRTVGVTITGTIKEPKINFFSVPAGLSQSEILSLLVLGRPLGQTSGSDAGLLMKALSAVDIGGSQSGMIKKQLTDNFGLDELSINATQDYDPDKQEVVENTSLTLGKRLSPKLFLNYSIGLLEPINVLRLNYTINNRLRLESETNINSSGVDLFYSIDKD